MNNVILLENGFPIDVPENMVKYLIDNNIQWIHYDIREKFWPVNRAETLSFFTNLPQNQVIITDHGMLDFELLELMIQLLYTLKEKNFTIKIMNGMLCGKLVKFIENDLSSITPKELEDDYNAELKFKTEMNAKFKAVLNYHNLYWIHNYFDDILLNSFEDIYSHTDSSSRKLKYK